MQRHKPCPDSAIQSFNSVSTNTNTASGAAVFKYCISGPLVVIVSFVLGLPSPYTIVIKLAGNVPSYTAKYAVEPAQNSTPIFTLCIDFLLCYIERLSKAELSKNFQSSLYICMLCTSYDRLSNKFRVISKVLVWFCQRFVPSYMLTWVHWIHWGYFV